MSLCASACLSYGPWAGAGVYAPIASVRTVASPTVFIRDSMVRHVGQLPSSRKARRERCKRCAAATGIGPAGADASCIVDIGEHLPRGLGVTDVHLNFHGTGRDIEATGKPPEPDQVLQALALGHERDALQFERPLREREGDRVPGLEDRELAHFSLMIRDTSPDIARGTRPCRSCRARSQTPRDYGRWPGTARRTPSPRALR